ncbi:MAG: damage-control phosphatase ARMT1 family protein [Thermoleophilia bacterium]
MLIWSDCIPCSLRLALSLARSALRSEEEVEAFMREVLALPAFSAGDWNLTSPHLTGAIWRLLVERSGNPDPLAQAKAAQNTAALALYPAAREHVVRSSDPFLEAVKLAILGNAIDAMVDTAAAPAEGLLETLGTLSLDPDAVSALRRRLADASRIAWFSDNCGEIVFDRLLLEVLRSQWEVDVAYITHTLPVLNDALLADALAVGLGEVARVMENGAGEALPGNLVADLGPQAAAAVRDASLVVSKGVANFELLSWEGSLKGRVSFLLHGKCHPVCSANEVGAGDLVVHNG